MSILLYHHFNSHGDIAFFAYMVSPHGYHTIGVTSLSEHNFISEVTQLNEGYKYSPVNYLSCKTPYAYVMYHLNMT